MGGRDSSSKRKSSKRKRDKISSKKKSRRKEPKKLRRVYDSVASDSDSDSLNAKYSSSSTSLSDHRRRMNKSMKHRRVSSLSSYSDYESVSSDSDSDIAYKSRKAQRSQVVLKDKKRRGWKRFISPAVQKRKRYDNRVVKPMKKSSNKKSRKYSSSSSSSDLETCRRRSSSNTADGLHRRSKVIPDKEIEKLRGREPHREPHRGRKKRKVRTPSSSSDRVSHPSVGISNPDGSPLFPMNNSGRLRSVIAVVSQPHDERENRWEMEPHKEEEIVYDQNDYPSPKSVDSNNSHGTFSNRTCVENVVGEEVPEWGNSRTDVGDQGKAGDRQLEGAHMNNCEKEKESDVSVPDAVSGGDLLESTLRQKALENLRKFKGKMGPTSTTAKINNKRDVGRSSTGTVDIVENQPINQGTSNAQETDQRSGLSYKGEFSLMTEVKKLPHNEEVDKDPPTAKQSLVHQPNNGTSPLECSNEDKPTSRNAIACSSSTIEPSSSGRPISGPRTVQGNEAEDASQFEQKTMSVMRGGEIVQVSYKVYIPKKAPGPTRRQLRR